MIVEESSAGAVESSCIGNRKRLCLRDLGPLCHGSYQAAMPESEAGDD